MSRVEGRWWSEQRHLKLDAVWCHNLRHSGATRSVEPGIHNHDRAYGFRARAKGRVPE
jgi:hypothetical protein